jgi:hypothetical protein
MGIASRKITIGVWESRLILYRNPQSRNCLLETSAEEQSGTDQECLILCLRAGAKAQSQLSVLDREMRFAGPPHFRPRGVAAQIGGTRPLQSLAFPGGLRIAGETRTRMIKDPPRIEQGQTRKIAAIS